MVQMVMSRNLEVAEIRKFEAMLAWARHKIRSRPSSSKVDAKIEFKWYVYSHDGYFEVKL